MVEREKWINQTQAVTDSITVQAGGSLSACAH